jgi:ParB family chromosome partitioning protein
MNDKVAQRRGLGRGLEALLGGAAAPRVAEPTAAAGSRATATLPISQIAAGRFQPRRRFVDDEIEALAASIREKGVLQPVLVRPITAEPGRYELVAGERRWRAAQRAQLHEIPVVVREFSDQEALEVALVENLQRANLNPIEEAQGFRRLLDEFGHTQDDLARVIGRSRSHLANTLRLLALPEAVQRLVEAGELSSGHARLLVGMDEKAANATAQQMVAKQISVREAERLVQRLKQEKPGAQRAASVSRSADIVALERDLGNRLGLKVEIQHRGEGGQIVIRYKTLEQFDDLLTRLK